MKRLLLAAVLLAPAAATRAAPPPTAAAFDSMLRCRTIAVATERLACFDQAATALDQAQSRHDIVVMDRQEIRQTRRSLFGFALPAIPLFAHDEGSAKGKEARHEEEEDAQISSTIREAHEGPDGWVVTLEDGAVWRQTGGETVGATLKPGMAVIVRRGALGSYFLKPGNRPGFKVRRER
ncbi:hypothetical protein [Sphingomonas morindae]|uniref:Uncharacterized protein n=1 Tax=Sphingomonas morindae TaxID=1541170 RepID=A0ABY4X9G8_9SPHN|nr:hypothetical protein [Sphingomonas morindae]USI73325.1 hypothetical protein LHA26_02255 [Sphingomonas morindae]